MSSRGRKVNATGRSIGEGQYASVAYSFLQSAAWRSLSGPAVKVWLELRTRYNGGNNGKLALSLDAAARVLRLGKATIARALAELEEKGFIVRTKRGKWYGREASLYRTTDKSAGGSPPTNDWKHWQPPEKQSLGSETDPLAAATGPLQNRRSKIWSATEPVRAA
jgi:hypothetical protein